MTWQIETYDPDKSADPSLVAYPPDSVESGHATKAACIAACDGKAAALKAANAPKPASAKKREIYALVSPEGVRDVRGLPQ